MQTATTRLQGARTFYFDRPSVDQLLAMVLTLSGEVWALRERVLTIEALLHRKGIVSPEELDSYEFSDSEEALVAELRRELLSSLFALLERRRAAGGASRKSPSTARKASKKRPRRR